MTTPEELENALAAFQPTTYLGWDNQGQRAEEWFRFGAWAWDIARARKLLLKTPRPSRPVQVDGLEKLIGEIAKPGMTRDELATLKCPLLGIGINWPKAMCDAINLDVPILLAPMGEAPMVIDGWHRVARALAIGRKVLPGILFSEEDAKKFILSRPPKPRATRTKRTAKSARPLRSTAPLLLVS